MYQCWEVCLYLRERERERETVTITGRNVVINSSIVFTQHGILLGEKIEDLMVWAYMAQGKEDPLW